MASGKPSKTKEKIISTAIDVFKKRGYENTTMRLISQKASVSLGSSYYYFPSKEHLFQNVYLSIQEELYKASREHSKDEHRLKEKLSISFITILSELEQFRSLASIMLKNAADPDSSINPFSEQSKETRQKSYVFYSELVLTCDQDFDPDIEHVLPVIFWLYENATVLFWLNDQSFGRVKTYEFIDKSLDLVLAVLKFLKLPMSSPLKKQIIRLVDEVSKNDRKIV